MAGLKKQNPELLSSMDVVISEHHHSPIAMNSEDPLAYMIALSGASTLGRAIWAFPVIQTELANLPNFA